MTSLTEAIAGRVVGTVEEVYPDRISVLLETNAPQATALNTGSPAGFPRINGYVLIPNETGATVGLISSVRIERLPFPKRKGMQDFGLLDLPYPSRVMSLAPLGTLTAGSAQAELSFEVRRGVDVFPSVGDPVLLPTQDQLRAVVEGERGTTEGRIQLGRCPTAGGSPVFVDPDKLFGRHLAVLGNTGGGKSCTIAGLIRWSLAAAARKRTHSSRLGPPNARFIVLDPNGEYDRAFSDLETRVFRVDPEEGQTPLRVPAWLWNGEEWSAFSDAAPGVQRPILFEALRRLRAGTGVPDEFGARARARVRRYRNLIRVSIDGAEHQQRGLREGVAQTLLNAQQDFEALLEEEGCSDPQLSERLKAIAELAAETEASARSNFSRGQQWHNNFPESSLETLLRELDVAASLVGLPEQEPAPSEDIPSYFPVEQLGDFVQALAAVDTFGRDLVQFVDSLNLRIRSLLSRGRLASVLQPEDSGSTRLEDWLDDYIGSDQAANGQIAVIDLALVPAEVIQVVVAVLARMIFETVQRYRRGQAEELPTVLVLEEAHTFVHRDLGSDVATPAGRVCCRVFERIAREGRKFGLGLVLASQRPSEVSPTVLSQCNTFILHRIVNDQDQSLVRRLVPDGLAGFLRELPSLPSRRALLLGWAAAAPVLLEVREVPEPYRPHSPDPAFWEVWTGEQERRIDWAKLVRAWVSAGAVGTQSSESEGSE